MMSIFRRRRSYESDADITEKNAGRAKAPQQFTPIPCLEGLVWIEDGCLHKSGIDTSQSFRLPLNDISDIIADWDFYKENPTPRRNQNYGAGAHGPGAGQLRRLAVRRND